MLKNYKSLLKKTTLAEIAKDFNTIFEKGKMETDYGNREDLANENLQRIIFNT